MCVGASMDESLWYLNTYNMFVWEEGVWRKRGRMCGKCAYNVSLVVSVYI